MGERKIRANALDAMGFEISRAFLYAKQVREKRGQIQNPDKNYSNFSFPLSHITRPKEKCFCIFLLGLIINIW